jgi:hypothetical protein
MGWVEKYPGWRHSHGHNNIIIPARITMNKNIMFEYRIVQKEFIETFIMSCRRR